MIYRDLNLILDAYEKGEKFYLYTGRYIPHSLSLTMIEVLLLAVSISVTWFPSSSRNGSKTPLTVLWWFSLPMMRSSSGRRWLSRSVLIWVMKTPRISLLVVLILRRWELYIMIEWVDVYFQWYELHGRDVLQCGSYSEVCDGQYSSIHFWF